ncbi:VOC family protein [Aquimarina agarilytica]|uniref:VOC family protein n=1 Tax=Aquimarina agarilytica TaxID=1087449 RepID=UPI000289EB41|nr:VOC family protein [Aquimarina agarilytica]
MFSKRPLDHIVYSVLDLDIAIQFFKEKIGVSPIFGGYHKNQGTKNALINLDNGCYLELLAVDTENTNIKSPRWMGVDVLTKNQITRFALKSTNLKKDSHLLKEYHDAMGIINNGQRKTPKNDMLKWKLTLPLATPEVEIVPFTVDWSNSEIHPSEFLPNMNCKLVKLYGTHPNVKKFDPLFEKLNFSIPIEKSEQISLKMVIDTPNGLVTL